MRAKKVLSILFALALVLSSLPASAIAESIEDAGKYSVVVSYVNVLNDEEIHAPSKQVVNEGESWSVTAPTITGYDLEDPAQATVTGVASGSDHYIKQTVYYMPGYVTYTIKRMKEMTTGNYVEASSEENYGVPDSIVTASDVTYPGFVRTTTDLSLKVTADGKAVKYIYYDRNPRSAIYFSTSGSELSPVIGNPGDPVPAVPNPTRTGYTFAGWDLNDDGIADSLPTTMPQEPVTAKALWTPATATYHYAYFIQDPNNPSNYNYVTTTSASGTVGTMTATAPVQPNTGVFRFETYSHESNPTPIAADGSTTINVYYNLATITVNVRPKINGSILATLTLRYGESFNPYAINPNTGNKYSDDMLAAMRADDPSGTYYWYGIIPGVGGIATTNPAKTTDPGAAITADNVFEIYGRYTNSTTLGPRYRFYYYQNLDGTYDMGGDHTLSRPNMITEIANNAGDGYLESESRHPGFSYDGYRTSIGHFDGTNYDALGWTSWQPYNYDYLITNYNSNLIEHRYKRNTYTVTYVSSGTTVATHSHLFGESFNASTDVPGTSLTSPRPGYVFKGWYDNSETVGTPVTETTMPATNTVLYAKWVPLTATVTFDSEGGSPVNSQELTYGDAATKPADPVREGYTFAGWILYTNGNPSVYSFSAAVTGDITLHALWKKNDSSVSYTVIHQTDDGQILSTTTETAQIGSLVSKWALDAADRGDYAYVDVSSRSMVIDENAENNVLTFTYSKEARYSYTVHYVDAQTGEQIHSDDIIGSQTLNLQNVSAREIDGYTLQGDSTGYVSADQLEYTFYYTKNPEAPATPQTPAKRKSALPETGDASSVALVGTALTSVAALGTSLVLRRRKRTEA